MRRILFLIFLLICVVTLSGCKGEISRAASDNIISSDMLSPAVYSALEKEWSAWNAKDEMQKMVSSHLPGNIYKQFETWAECEEFVGFELWNPLEDSEFEKGSYVGMPVGANDASRFYVSVYGTNERQVQWIHVQSGYLDGEVSINVNAQISPDVLKGNADNQEPLITEDSGERYVATEALLSRGPVTYNIRIIGDKNEWDAVRATLEKVLPYFQSEEKLKELPKRLPCSCFGSSFVFYRAFLILIIVTVAITSGT